MARPSEISTKTIAFRVPMEDYLRFLTEATKSKLSLSEYMTLRIYSEDVSKANSKTVADKDQKIKSLDQEVKKLTEKINTSAQAEKKLNSDISALKNELKGSEAEKTALSNKLKSNTMTATDSKKLETKITELEKEVKELKADKLKFEALKKDLFETNQKSQKVLAEHKLFVKTTVEEMEGIVKKKGREFLPEVTERLNKLK